MNLIVDMYKDYCIAVMLGSLITLALFFILISMHALSGGQYGMIMMTNIYGEHWPELLMFLAAIPGSIKIFWDVVRGDR